MRQRGLGTHVVAHLDADSESPADTVDHLLVSTHAASPGTVRSFRIDYLLPKSAGNGYQGANATIVLTFRAVQASNNTLNSNCTTAGWQCPAGNGFLWN